MSLTEFLPASDFLYSVPVGTVLLSADLYHDRDVRYVFVGWRRNTARDEMVFCEVYEESRYYGAWKANGEPWIYKCSGYETALRKFPGLKEYVSDPRDKGGREAHG